MYFVKVDGLLLVVSNSAPLAEQRKKFERFMDYNVELVNEQTSCHQAIADSIVELKVSLVDIFFLSSLMSNFFCLFNSSSVLSMFTELRLSVNYFMLIVRLSSPSFTNICCSCKSMFLHILIPFLLNLLINASQALL